MISEMHNPYIFVSAMCNFKMKLHFLFITKLSLSVCWNVVLSSLPSALSGDFSGNSLMCSRIIAQFCFLFKCLSFACAAGDPCEMFILLDTIVFQVYLPVRSLTCPLIREMRNFCFPLIPDAGTLNFLAQIPVFNPLFPGGHSMWSYGWQKGTACPCSESRGGNLKYCYQENYSDIY